MFGSDFSKKTVNTAELPIEYDESYSNSVTHIAPLMWGEHCVECGVPACYKTCGLYERRIDGACRRFVNGIETMKGYGGLYSYMVKVEMMKWAKLGAVLLPHCLPKNKVLRQSRYFDCLTSFVQLCTALVPCSLFSRASYYLKEFITRMEGKGEKAYYPEYLLIEISNPDDEYGLFIENTSCGKTLYRNRVGIRKGFNRHCVPFSELHYSEGQRNFLSVIPENEKQTVYLHSLDLVKTAAADKTPEIKCVVWDLDNTLWTGILSEGDDVKLRKDSIEHIKKLDEKGILNSICSKNEYNEAYKKLKEFNIDQYFLYPQINWNPKSENIQIIARSLNINADTLMFIDDTEFELAEVSKKLPMVRCFNVRDMEEAMRQEALRREVTEEGKRRRQSYREIETRNQAERTFSGTIDDFLRSCAMKMTIAYPAETSICRCYELINRTNQLNISGKRLSLDELKGLIRDNMNYLCLQISCIDRFGDYGIIGFCVIDLQNQSEAVLEHFVFSCRAAGKKLEQSFIEYMINYFNKNKINKFAIHCIKTPKNHLLLNALSELEYLLKIKITDTEFMLELKEGMDYQKLNLVEIESLIEQYVH